MLTAAVTALTRTDDTAGVVLVGGAVTLLAWVLTPLWLAGVLFVSPAVAVAAPVALAPWLVARGYFVRVTRAAIQPGDAAGAPPLVAWGELVRDGLKSTLLSAALLAPLVGGLGVAVALVAALVAGPADPVAAAVASTIGPAGPAAVAVAGVLAAALVGAYLLAFAYVRPAALAAFAASGRLRDGLNPRTVAGVAGTGPYATGWTLAVGVLAVGYAVAAPAVPLIVGVALAFLVRVVAHGLYGRGAAATLTEGATDGDVRSDALAAREAETAREVGAARVATPRGASADPEAGPRTGGSPAPAVSGDGGHPMRSEPTPAVQVGRTVPVGPDGDVVESAGSGSDDSAGGSGNAAGYGDAAGCGDEEERGAGGFEWGPTLADPEDKS